MLRLYKNKSQSFQCRLEIDGSRYTKAKPRLIFYPDSDSRNLMFEGTLKNNNCTVLLTPNVDITNHGKVVLEVVVDDSTLFSPWSSTYEIIVEQAKIENNSIQLKMDSSPVTMMRLAEDVGIVEERIIEPIQMKKEEEKIEKERVQNEVNHAIEEQKKENTVVEHIEKNWNTVPKDLVREIQKKYKISGNDAWKIFREVQSEMRKKITKEELQKEKIVVDNKKTNQKQLFTESCSPENKNLVNEYLIAIKNLSSKDRKSFLKYMVENYTPTGKSVKWAKPIFSDLNSLTAKICMYCNEVKK